MEPDRITYALRALGTEESRRPSRVSVEAVIRTGRRRIRIRRGVAAALVAVAVAAVSFAVPTVRHLGAPPVQPALPAPVTCVERPLPVPPVGPPVILTAGDPTGRYLAGMDGPIDGPSNDGILWTDGHPVTFPIAGDHVDVTDVSSTGAVIGDRGTAHGRVGWIWTGGRIADLTGPNTIPRAINGHGEIVGYVTQDPNAQVLRSTPIVWRSPTATARTLPLPQGYSGGQATDVDEDGTILGRVTDGVNGIRAAIWLPDGRPLALPVPSDLPGAVGVYPISARGGTVIVVVGAPGTATRPERDLVLAYTVSTGLYRPLPQATIFDFGLLGGYSVDQSPTAPITEGWSPTTANTRGWVVGMDRQQQASLYAPGTGFVLLPAKAGRDAPGEFGGAVVHSVSDDGTVIGGIDHVRGTTAVFPVTWTCR
jgi:hypothetical protein